MLQRLLENFRKGIARTKWVASVFTERVRIEITIIKLLYRSDEMDKKREELLKTIGQRVYDSRTIPDKDIFKDRVVIDALTEIENIERNIGELRQRIAEIGSVGT
jgi:hypothetical protein